MTSPRPTVTVVFSPWPHEPTSSQRALSGGAYEHEEYKPIIESMPQPHVLNVAALSQSLVQRYHTSLPMAHMDPSQSTALVAPSLLTKKLPVPLSGVATTHSSLPVGCMHFTYSGSSTILFPLPSKGLLPKRMSSFCPSSTGSAIISWACSQLPISSQAPFTRVDCSHELYTPSAVSTSSSKSHVLTIALPAHGAVHEYQTSLMMWHWVSLQDVHVVLPVLETV
mmetsp:Transcript_40705/g.100115  ORF Transcript_40705/g.100115 Transcript_40705/m.100115 type:complete len:224 (+) Transcript_40705:1641-2312(+)